ARGLERVALVGGSMGGVVAQHFALRHPARLARLLLVATGGAMGDPAAGRARADAVAAAPWDAAAVEPVVAGVFRGPPPAERLAELRRIALMTSHVAAVEAARSNAGSRTLEWLGEIRVPTLIIQGRHDRARTPEHGAAMRDRIPGSRLEVLEGSGHTPPLQEPDALHALPLPQRPLMARPAWPATGAGSPVVLIHGLGLDHRMWERQVLPLVGAGHRVIACDLPGHGTAERPTRAGSAYTTAELARSLVLAL